VLPLIRITRLRTAQLFLATAMTLQAIAAPHNPTVKVLPKPAAAVPCDPGTTAAPPRLNPAEVPAPGLASMPPPRADLKSRLRDTQDAAVRSLRPEFQTALDSLRKMLPAYAAGGERDAATEVVKVYDDLDRLWTYEFEKNAGGFFDAASEGGTLLRMLRAYPEYGRYIAAETLTVGGSTIYPSRESRRFLVNEAARRSAGLTGAPVPAETAIRRVPARPPVAATGSSQNASGTEERTSSATPAVAHSAHHSAVSGQSSSAKKPAQSKTATHAKRRPRASTASAGQTGTRKSASSTKTAKKTKTSSPATAVKPPAKPAPEPAPRESVVARVPPVSKPSSTAPVAPPVTTTQPAQTATVAISTAVQPPPVISTTDSTQTLVPSSTASGAVSTGTALSTSGSAIDTSVTSSGASVTDTTSSAAVDTAITDTVTGTNAPAATPVAPATHSMLVPIVLIVIGLGVLILLFRTSN
jgi:hypothetical protein